MYVWLLYLWLLPCCCSANRGRVEGHTEDCVMLPLQCVCVWRGLWGLAGRVGGGGGGKRQRGSAQ